MARFGHCRLGSESPHWPAMVSALIVDDEEDMRVLLRATIELANDGLEVASEAADGEEAIAAWREHHPDCVIIDARMPKLSGMDAARVILAEDPNQAIILFSASMSQETRIEAEALGIRACLSKDDLFTIPSLLHRLAG